jgi:hypothetical protein
MGEAYYESVSNVTQNYWEHPSGLLYTDSVKDFAEGHEATGYWMMSSTSILSSPTWV